MELRQGVLDVLEQVIESKGCPFLDQSIYGEDCHVDCICRMFNNTDMTCYEMAKRIKSCMTAKNGQVF